MSEEDSMHRMNSNRHVLPLQLGYFQTEQLHLLLQFGLLQPNAALDDQTSGVGQPGMEVFTLQD